MNILLAFLSTSVSVRRVIVRPAFLGPCIFVRFSLASGSCRIFGPLLRRMLHYVNFRSTAWTQLISRDAFLVSLVQVLCLLSGLISTLLLICGRLLPAGMKPDGATREIRP